MQNRSKQILNFWKTGHKDWSPEEVSKKLGTARIDRLLDLTSCLSIWNDKNIKKTEGVLILAYTNLGALVEGWLMFFYCIYYMDYIKAPIKKRKTEKMIEPNNLRLDDLVKFSNDNLWLTDDELEKRLNGQFINEYLFHRISGERKKWIEWLKKIQHRRNAIHSFNDKEIGTSIEYLEDISYFADFIDFIDNRLPYPDKLNFKN